MDGGFEELVTEGVRWWLGVLWWLERERRGERDTE